MCGEKILKVLKVYKILRWIYFIMLNSPKSAGDGFCLTVCAFLSPAPVSTFHFVHHSWILKRILLVKTDDPQHTNNKEFRYACGRREVLVVMHLKNSFTHSSLQLYLAVLTGWARAVGESDLFVCLELWEDDFHPFNSLMVFICSRGNVLPITTSCAIVSLMTVYIFKLVILILSESFLNK